MAGRAMDSNHSPKRSAARSWSGALEQLVEVKPADLERLGIEPLRVIRSDIGAEWRAGRGEIFVKGHDGYLNDLMPPWPKPRGFGIDGRDQVTEQVLH